MEQALNLLQTLAAKIGTTAEHFWPVWVDYCFAKQIGLSITTFIITIIGSILFITGMKFGKENSWDDGSPNYPKTMFLLIFGGLALLVSSLMFAGSLPYLVAAISSPEGFALARLLAVR